MKTRAVFLALVTLMAILSCVYSLPTDSVTIPNTFSILTNYTINASSGLPTDIRNAVNTVIAHGGGTVYIPAGDWRCDQQPVTPYGYGGAIPIDLETLPSGAWLSIIGSFSNVTTITQNGVSITCPATILRSYAVNNNNLTAPIATFGIVGSNDSYPANFNFINSQNKHIRISGITILGDVMNEGTVNSYSNIGISLSFVDNYYVDNCWIDSNTGSDIGSSYSKGVVTNCTITDLYHLSEGGQWGYGVQVGGNFGFYNNGLGTPTWIQNVSQVIGKYDWQGITLNYMIPVNGNDAVQGTTSSISYTAGPVYIERCLFNTTRHVVSSSEYGYYVMRYCVCYGGVGLQMGDSHGGGWSYSANAYATRGIEYYNNTFYGQTSYSTGTYGLMMRGGAGLIFNNTFNNILTGVKLGNENYNSSDPNDVEYINDVWIWNNTFNSVSSVLSVASGQSIVGGTNYFSDIPPATSPAPPKQGYIPYTYPNPLAFPLR